MIPVVLLKNDHINNRTKIRGAISRGPITGTATTFLFIHILMDKEVGEGLHC